MTVRNNNLVVPLASKATATRDEGTADNYQAEPGAVSLLIGNSLRRGDVDSTTMHSTQAIPITPTTRTSTTAIRIGTTRTTSSGRVQSADYESRQHTHADFSFEELFQAYLDCRKRKTNTIAAIEFTMDLGHNLFMLYEELQDGSYKPGRSTCFVITYPKPREVWAADFRDRIVHHLLYNHVSKRFHDSFIADSCACIPGRGTLYAAKRLESKIRSITQNWSVPAHYLKMDLANFFVSIDKNIVRELLAEKIYEPWWMELAELILFHDPRLNYEFRGKPESINLVPAHKRLLNQSSDRGLAIGNLPSQFCANVLMNPFDQYCKHRLGARHYIRYVDDFILLHHNAQWLEGAKRYIEAWLPHTLGLRVNPSKTIQQPIPRGVDFVGQVIKPWRRSTRRRTVIEAIRRINTAPESEVFEKANSYYGLLGQASHSRKDRIALTHAIHLRGFTVNGMFSKAYRKAIHGKA